MNVSCVNNSHSEINQFSVFVQAFVKSNLIHTDYG